MLSGNHDCEVKAYKLEKTYDEVSVCEKEMAAVLKPKESDPDQNDYSLKHLDEEAPMYYNYGCVNYPTNPGDNIDAFTKRIYTLYGPGSEKNNI